MNVCVNVEVNRRVEGSLDGREPHKYKFFVSTQNHLTQIIRMNLQMNTAQSIAER